jgi:uncharacterized protein YjbJ (UPF0337 family)
MNQDTVKGTFDDVAGRARRQVGEWTGDTNAQVNGAAQQVKGKIEKVVGNVKDAARDVNGNAKSKDELENEARERERREAEHKLHQTIGS